MQKIELGKKAILDGLIELFRQHRRWLIFIGTGTSCALDKRLGMPALEGHLRRKMPENMDGWPSVLERLESGQGLEDALTGGVSLPPETKNRIKELTGTHVAKRDLLLRDKVLLGSGKKWPGESLLCRLVERLPPSSRRLPVVTPNYDMLIEYVCAKNGIRYTTGYAGELIRRLNWRQAQDSLTRYRTSQKSGKPYREPLSHVELHKVHGSINLFRHADGSGLVECDAWVGKPPANCSREIAAPGDQKYQAYAENPDSGSSASEAEDHAAAFLVIGYGFNDPYLHDRILGRVRRDDCPLLVLTLDLPDATITSVRRSGTQVWVLTAGKSDSGGLLQNHTRVACPLAASELHVRNERLWSCDHFANSVLEG